MAEALDIEGLLNGALDLPAFGAIEDPVIATIPEVIRFTTRGVQPPGALYVTREDRLIATVYNSLASAAYVLQGRILNADGTIRAFSRGIVPTSDRVGNEFSMELPEGFLLSAGVTLSSGTPKFGQTFVNLALTRGVSGSTVHFFGLTSGYIESENEVWWPSSPPQSFVYGPGFLRVITGTDPAAGSEISETVPTNARWRLNVLRFTFVADGTAVTRRPRLIIAQDGTTFYSYSPNATVAASDNLIYNFGRLLGHEQASGFSGVWVGGLPEIILPEGSVISTSTINLQAGDNYSAPVLQVEEWIER